MPELIVQNIHMGIDLKEIRRAAFRSGEDVSTRAMMVRNFAPDMARGGLITSAAGTYRVDGARRLCTSRPSDQNAAIVSMTRRIPAPSVTINRRKIRPPLSLFILCGFLWCGLIAMSGEVRAQSTRTILAVGAHAGDAELTSGPLLVHQRRRGDRIVILHMSLGERGHANMSPEEYAMQKRREAEEAAGVIGAEVRFAPYEDGSVPDSEEARRYVAEVIQEVQPTYVLTHWRESLHRDHAATHAIVEDAVLLAALQETGLPNPPYRGVRGIYYAENWEDADAFEPYVYVDVSAAEVTWREAVRKYEFVRGDISSFPYLEYYEALHVVRGAEARSERAVAFDIARSGKKRILDALP